MSLKQSAVSGIKWTALSTAITTTLQLVQMTVLARLLKPSDFGLMAMTMVVIGFAQTYTDMGISAAIVHRQDVTREHLSSLYWLNILAGLAVFTLVCVASPLVVWFFHEPLLFRLLPVVAISFLISSLSLQFNWLLEKGLRFNLLAKQDIFAGFCGALVAIVSAFLEQGVWSLVWGQLINAGVKTALLLLVGWSQWTPMIHFRRSDLRGFLSFGLYQMGERSINYFNSRIDQLMIGNLLGAQQLGYYNFAINLVMQPVSAINPIMTRVAFPVFARIQNDLTGLRQSYIKMMSILSTVNAPLLFGMASVTPLLIPLVFGDKWTPAVMLVQILAFYSFIRGTGNPVGSLLLAKGRADLGFHWNLVLLFTTAPVVYIGARLGDALGIAVALTLLMIVYSAANYFFLVRPLIGPCSKPYAASVLKPAMLAFVMGGCVWAISFGGLHSLTALVAKIAAGAVIYLTLLWFIDRNLVFEVKALLRGSAS